MDLLVRLLGNPSIGILSGTHHDVMVREIIPLKEQSGYVPLDALASLVMLVGRLEPIHTTYSRCLLGTNNEILLLLPQTSFHMEETDCRLPGYIKDSRFIYTNIKVCDWVSNRYKSYPDGPVRSGLPEVPMFSGK